MNNWEYIVTSAYGEKHILLIILPSKNVVFLSAMENS